MLRELPRWRRRWGLQRWLALLGLALLGCLNPRPEDDPSLIDTVDPGPVGAAGGSPEAPTGGGVGDPDDGSTGSAGGGGGPSTNPPPADGGLPPDAGVLPDAARDAGPDAGSPDDCPP